MKSKPKSKKGQIMGMPFIYIFALIVGGIVLAWGLRTVIKLAIVGEEVQIADFLKSLESNIKSYYMLEAGSENPVPIRLPKKVQYLCVIDVDGGPDGCKVKKDSTNYVDCPASIKDLVTSDFFDLSIGNFYVLPAEEFKNVGFPVWKKNKEKIDLKCGNSDCSPLCYKPNQKIIVKSMGDKVQLS